MAGTVTLSVEIELGWGFHDLAPPSEVPELSDDGNSERAALHRLLELCDEFGISVTFDIVGHLLLDSCTGTHDGPHPDGWFDRDPGTDAASDPLFYAPEVVEWIRNADVAHEICTHTFSHVLCDEVPAEVVDWELKRVKPLHDRPVRSLVPPRQRELPVDLIRENGIRVIRDIVDEPSPTGPIHRLFWTLSRDHPLDDPETIDGVVRTRTAPLMTLTSTTLSKGNAPPHAAFRMIPERVRQSLHESFLCEGLDRAVQTDGHIHYWTHLYNLADDSQWPPIEAFCAELGEMVDDAMAEVRPMQELSGSV